MASSSTAEHTPLLREDSREADQRTKVDEAQQDDIEETALRTGEGASALAASNAPTQTKGQTSSFLAGIDHRLLHPLRSRRYLPGLPFRSGDLWLGVRSPHHLAVIDPY